MEGDSKIEIKVEDVSFDSNTTLKLNDSTDDIKQETKTDEISDKNRASSQPLTTTAMNPTNNKETPLQTSTPNKKQNEQPLISNLDPKEFCFIPKIARLLAKFREVKNLIGNVVIKSNLSAKNLNGEVFEYFNKEQLCVMRDNIFNALEQEDQCQRGLIPNSRSNGNEKQSGLQSGSQSGNQSQPGGKSGTQSGPKSTTQTDIKSTTQIGLKSATQTGLKFSTQTGLKSVTQTGPKSVTQPAVKTGTQLVTKSDPQPVEKTGTQPAEKPDTQPGEKSGTQPVTKPDTEPTENSGTQPTTQPDTLPESQSETQPKILPKKPPKSTRSVPSQNNQLPPGCCSEFCNPSTCRVTGQTFLERVEAYRENLRLRNQNLLPNTTGPFPAIIPPPPSPSEERLRASNERLRRNLEARAKKDGYEEDVQDPLKNENISKQNELDHTQSVDNEANNNAPGDSSTENQEIQNVPNESKENEKNAGSSSDGKDVIIKKEIIDDNIDDATSKTITNDDNVQSNIKIEPKDKPNDIQQNNLNVQPNVLNHESNILNSETNVRTVTFSENDQEFLDFITEQTRGLEQRNYPNKVDMALKQSYKKYCDNGFKLKKFDIDQVYSKYRNQKNNISKIGALRRLASHIEEKIRKVFYINKKDFFIDFLQLILEKVLYIFYKLKVEDGEGNPKKKRKRVHKNRRSGHGQRELNQEENNREGTNVMEKNLEEKNQGENPVPDDDEKDGNEDIRDGCSLKNLKENSVMIEDVQKIEPDVIEVDDDDSPDKIVKKPLNNHQLKQRQKKRELRSIKYKIVAFQKIKTKLEECTSGIIKEQTRDVLQRCIECIKFFEEKIQDRNGLSEEDLQQTRDKYFSTKTECLKRIQYLMKNYPDEIDYQVYFDNLLKYYDNQTEDVQIDNEPEDKSVSKNEDLSKKSAPTPSTSRNSAVTKKRIKKVPQQLRYYKFLEKFGKALNNYYKFSVPLRKLIKPKANKNKQDEQEKNDENQKSKPNEDEPKKKRGCDEDNSVESKRIKLDEEPNKIDSKKTESNQKKDKKPLIDDKTKCGPESSSTRSQDNRKLSQDIRTENPSRKENPSTSKQNYSFQEQYENSGSKNKPSDNQNNYWILRGDQSFKSGHRDKMPQPGPSKLSPVKNRSQAMEGKKSRGQVPQLQIQPTSQNQKQNMTPMMKVRNVIQKILREQHDKESVQSQPYLQGQQMNQDQLLSMANITPQGLIQNQQYVPEINQNQPFLQTQQLLQAQPLTAPPQNFQPQQYPQHQPMYQQFRKPLLPNPPMIPGQQQMFHQMVTQNNQHPTVPGVPASQPNQAWKNLKIPAPWELPQSIPSPVSTKAKVTYQATPMISTQIYRPPNKIHFNQNAKLTQHPPHKPTGQVQQIKPIRFTIPDVSQRKKPQVIVIPVAPDPPNISIPNPLHGTSIPNISPSTSKQQIDLTQGRWDQKQLLQNDLKNKLKKVEEKASKIKSSLEMLNFI